MSNKTDAPTRLFEGLFLFDANLASRDWPGLEKHVEELLKKRSAKLVYGECWPDRKLAYEVRGCKKGTYYLTYFEASPAAIDGLHRDCQLSERVLRLLVVRDEGIEEDLERRRGIAESAASAAKEAAEPAARETTTERKGSAEPVAAKEPGEAEPAGTTEAAET